MDDVGVLKSLLILLLSAYYYDRYHFGELGSWQHVMSIFTSNERRIDNANNDIVYITSVLVSDSLIRCLQMSHVEADPVYNCQSFVTNELHSTVLNQVNVVNQLCIQSSFAVDH